MALSDKTTLVRKFQEHMLRDPLAGNRFIHLPGLLWAWLVESSSHSQATKYELTWHALKRLASNKVSSNSLKHWTSWLTGLREEDHPWKISDATRPLKISQVRPQYVQQDGRYTVLVREYSYF
eukprot:scaffold169058_cov18-Prasinocladus_malaysianus.AAC.1